MDPEDDVRAVLTGAAGGTQPPMRLEAADVIEVGGRVRRRRKRWAVAGTSTATAVILAVAGFLAGHRAGPPAPVQPADPGLSTIGTTAPAPTTSPPAVKAPATSIAPPEAQPGRTSPQRASRTTVPTPATGRKTERPSSPPSAGPTETSQDAPAATTR
ncbi:hypothetical protein [Amycolatopsis sp. NPDC098790]|uniref:hypothetical protein n=1 Tax=Amycolatopsis sp. NPDC098790 TaxID=3363939 RepID=UPI003813CF4A